MKAFRDQYLGDRETQALTILDLGSRSIGGSYRGIFDSPNWTYKGLDLEPGDNVDIVLKEPYTWQEIASNSADIVISGQAFEHIEFFWLTMLEIARVLKPGGLCCIIAPSSGFEHRYPVDCWRFYSDGFAALARYANLEVLQAETKWQENAYVDGSNEWKDSILVAQKPTAPPFSKWDGGGFRGAFSGTKRYPTVEVDEHQLPDNHTLKKQLALVGYGKKVIDFGCATGYFARLLNHRECEVFGVEINPDAAKKAEAYCQEVKIANLDQVSVTDIYPDQKFDVAVFGDVLEHLYDPWKVLSEVRHILKPDGFVVASIPNIAHGAIRLALLQGYFDYSEIGLLDNTHIRFFTRDTVQKLFEQSGFVIEQMDRVHEGIFSGSICFPEVKREDFDPRLIAQLAQDQDSETLQFVIRAFPETIEGQYATLKQQYDAAVEKIEQLETELQASHDERAQLRLNLHNTHLGFQQCKATLEQTHQQFIQTQAELHRTQAELQHTQLELQHTQINLQQTQAALMVSHNRMQAMQSSKFWKLREVWMQIKRVFNPNAQ